MFNILVAEDDNNILKLMEIRLKHAGYDVFTAKDGEDALKKFEENHTFSDWNECKVDLKDIPL